MPDQAFVEDTGLTTICFPRGPGQLRITTPTPLPGVQRIEVAKGAQSGIYGSGASAGAISFEGLRPTEAN